VLGGARCAKNVFLDMLQSVLLAPVSYFETTPLGRILNRFTYDVEVIDVTLTESMSILMIAAGWFTTGVVVMVSIVPYVALALLPVTTIYWLLLLKYRRCGTDLQRLDAVARSPIHALVSEGMPTTRSRVGTLMDDHGFTCLVSLLMSIDQDLKDALRFVSIGKWGPLSMFSMTSSMKVARPW
jgi:ABC-type multidrug transport system fused ATPase/permease subunit